MLLIQYIRIYRAVFAACQRIHILQKEDTELYEVARVWTCNQNKLSTLVYEDLLGGVKSRLGTEQLSNCFNCSAGSNRDSVGS